MTAVQMFIVGLCAWFALGCVFIAGYNAVKWCVRRVTS